MNNQVAVNNNLKRKTDYIAFFAMVVGMFMAVLDIQIVASSLPKIAAGLSATNDELSWVQTSYLIAEVIVIPLSGFISRVFSTRITYFAAALGFTIMSIACALSWSIESMIFCRLFQGLFGGLLIPITFSTIFIIFTAQERLRANIIVGLVVTIAPTLGPVIGGYLTEIYSWHLMFLLNVLPGIFVCTVIYLYADFDKPNLVLLKNIDYLGCVSLILFLGILQYILEEGNRLGWFDSSLIILLSIVSFSSMIAFVIRCLSFSNPLVDLRAFYSRNFSLGCMYSFVIGIGLYGVVFLQPVFLATIGNLNSLQIGLIMCVTGIAQLCSAPIASKLFARGFSSKKMLFVGLSLFGIGCYMNSFLTLDSRFYEFFFPQVVRGVSLMFCFIPISNIALGDLLPAQIKSSSGLYNLTRNLGGAIGLAVIAFTLTNNTKIFASYIGDNITANDPNYINAIENISAMLSSEVSNQTASYLFLSNMIQQNSYTIAINDIFRTIALVFFCSTIFIVFIKNVKSDNMNDQNSH
ncbi:MAG: DHA2 family efflux MFS transporter permease subunit [Rickettsiaceae bacterium]|nr:DHA2 family efflux MFS transporter permease subunit [Rickettsiaceae bacterium]